MAGLELRLTQFGPALGWLLDKGVSSARLAALFATTPANIRVIAFRARHGTLPDQTSDSNLISGPTAEMREEIGIRPALDEVVRTPATKRRIEWLKNEIERTVERHSTRYTFLTGVRALRGLLPQVGYPGDLRRIALLALLHQHISWFLVHSGRCLSAAREARIACDLWRAAYHESGSKENGESFVQAALIGSHARLLSRRSREALQALDIARDASESIGAPLGSDHFRQRGVALFQLREDERAAKQFQTAAEKMEKMNEARVPAQLLMTGARHTCLLRDWTAIRRV